MKQLKGLEEFRKVIKKWKHSSFLCKLRKQNNYMITFLLLGVLFLAVLTLFSIFSFTLWVDIQFLLPCFCFCFVFFSFFLGLFHEHSRFTGHQVKEENFSFTSLYHFNPLHRHLDISTAITAENSPLHVASSGTQIGNLWFPSASR